MSQAARPQVVAVVGMTREARILAGTRALVAGRGNPTTLLDRLRALEPRAAGVISFGLCGALDPALGVGDLVVGDAVLGGEASYACDPAWIRRLMGALPTARGSTLASSPAPVASPQDKAALRARTGAATVDMESLVTARAASALDLPFAVLRAVSDAADRALPPAARVGLGPDGRPDVGAVLRSLARRPWQIAALARTAREADAGFRALVCARDLLGPGLGGPDLDESLLDVV